MTAAVVFLVLVYRAAIIGGCGYVVFGLGNSGWWFLLATLLCCLSPDDER